MKYLIMMTGKKKIECLNLKKESLILKELELYHLKVRSKYCKQLFKYLHTF